MTAAFGAARVAAFAGLSAWLPQARGRPLFEGMRIALAAQPDRSDPRRSARGHHRRGRGAGAPGVRRAARAA